MSMKLPKNKGNLERCSGDYIREIIRRYLAISAIAHNSLFWVAAKIAARGVEMLECGTHHTLRFASSESAIFNQQQNLNLCVNRA
jgi:hypothetical protein